MTYPWSIGVATGVGSLPYVDPDEAARIVIGELPDLPYLPELPLRGAGADMIGRTASLLVDLHVDLQPAGWRLTDRPGADERGAHALLRADLDALEIAALGYSGQLKLQVTGPLTLAASIERPRGDRALADYGARRDLAQSLAEGVREHVADVAKRVPGAQVVVQFDEPSLPAVLAGAIPTSSGFGRHRAVDPAEGEQLLAEVVRAAGEWAVLHCCASDVPVRLVQRAGARAVSLDVGLLTGNVLDELAEAVNDGLAVWPGIVPSRRPDRVPSDRELIERLERLFARLDADPAHPGAGTVVTPACGLAGADIGWAREVHRLVRDVARGFAEHVGEVR
ncbi:MAG TPA: methionine synthase [Jiangellaceae bacterium]|nr:methionine synthase [Jiangellaceae bacterium]